MEVVIVVVAEKPSVARDLAAVLGATKRHEGYLEGAGYQVTWALGHLVELGNPEDMCAEWKRWDVATLPMIPTDWTLLPRPDAKAQWKVVKKLLTARTTKELICATDAGREGELIFRYLVMAAGAKKPARRLWISSLTESAIRAGLSTMRPLSDYDRLADAALARARADWLVGMNLSRAYSLRQNAKWSVGRVQTPALALVVAREMAVVGFRPTPFWQVRFQGTAPNGEPAELLGQWRLERQGRPSWIDRCSIEAEANAVRERCAGHPAVVLEVARKEKREAPPKLFDLTSLQREANKLLGFTAAQTLEVAQELYEKHKTLSYPRTDSSAISKDVEAAWGRLPAELAGRYEDATRGVDFTAALSKRYVDGSKVSDHHALIPLAPDSGAPPGSPAARLFDLVARRFLGCWLADYREAATRVDCECRGQRFSATGSSVEDLGWKRLLLRQERPKAQLPGGLERGVCLDQVGLEVLKKTTTPPDRLTEGDLLGYMENAGNPFGGEMAEVMRGRGLGTPATRAATLETLLERGYVARKGKHLVPTELGVALIRGVAPKVASPTLTGEWELRLAKVEQGELTFEEFMQAIETFVRESVAEAIR